MRKNATLQVRMDSDIKDQVEKLYEDMGTSFSEAVRLFAQQSLLRGGLPFTVFVPPQPNQTAFGILAAYGNPDIRSREREFYIKAMEERMHGSD